MRGSYLLALSPGPPQARIQMARSIAFMRRGRARSNAVQTAKDIKTQAQAEISDVGALTAFKKLAAAQPRGLVALRDPSYDQIVASPLRVDKIAT